MSRPNTTETPNWSTRNASFVPPSRMPPHEQPHREYTRPQSQAIQSIPTDTPKDNSKRLSSIFSFRGKSSNNSPASPTDAQSSMMATQSQSGYFGAPAQSPQSPWNEHGVLSNPYSPSAPASSQPMQSATYPAPSQHQPPPPGPAQPAPHPNDTTRRRASLQKPEPQPPAHPAPLHPEIRSAVSLALAHQQKIYFSGPLIKRIERIPDGSKPNKDDGWVDVWAQLGGTTLSIWDMKAIEEANKRGEEVPPSYINVTDSFVQVLGSVTTPPTPTTPSQKYTNVLALNTAGSNLTLFACPSADALVSWASALRLSAWEKSRLEEIYTAHLLRMTLSENSVWVEPRTSLIKGRMEGWVKVRLAGQTNWQRVWAVITSAPTHQPSSSVTSVNQRPGSPNSSTLTKRNRLSSFFGSNKQEGTTPPANGNGNGNGNGPMHPLNPPLIQKPLLTFFVSNKAKDRKTVTLSLHDVTQVFAVYPERPELITRSTLIKMEGRFGDEEAAAGMRRREGWLLMMPEVDPHKVGTLEMLKWVVAFHDAFRLYGRPKEYTWNPRDSVSMMFAYPVGPQRDHLFLDRELVESLDPRDDRTSVVRSSLLNVLLTRMRQGPATPHPGGPPPPDRPPAMVDQSPPQGSVPPQAQPPRQPQPQSPQPQRQMSTLPPPPQFAQPTWDTLVSPTAKSGSSHIIPPLDFERDQNHPQTPLTHSNTQLTTITERSYAQDEHTRGPAPNQAVSGGGSGPQYSPVLTNEPEDVVSKAILDWMPEGDKRNMAIPRNSQESYFSGTASRPDSKFTPTPTTAAMAASRSAPGALPSPADIRPAPSNVPPPASTPPVAAAPMRRATTDSPRPGVSPESKTPPLSSMGQRSPSMLTTQTSLRSDTAPYANDAMGSISTHYTQSMDTVGSGPRQPTLKLGPANVPPQEVKDLPPTPYSPPLSRESSGLVPVESPKDFVFDESGMIYMPPSASPPARPSRTNTGPPTSAPSSAVDSTTSPSSSSAPSTRETEARAEQIQRKQTAFEDLSSVNPPPEVVPDAASHGVRALAIGRRPSGARANPTPRRVNLPSSDFENHQEETTDSDRDPAPIPPSAARYPRNTADMDDLGADALAALSFAEHGDEAAKKPMQPPRLQTPPPVTPGSAGVTPLYPSSFASGKAAERKAKLEAQNAAAQAAISKPGRPSGGASGKAKGGWNESSDEEEDDEEDDDEDEDEGPSRGREKLGATSAGSVPSIYAPQPQQRSRLATGGGTFADYGAPPRPLPSPDSHTRASRVLPPIPGRSPTGYPNSQENQLRAQQEYSHGVIQSQSRSSSGQYDDLGRPRTYYDDAPQHMRRDVDRSGSRERPPAPPRQSIWTSVLDPNTKTAPNSGNNKDTFITLEPNQTMTKAFAPQGLLQAGIQDKEDRSAKRQEELARESGASLVNVPSKPPPPQTGLLGAITAHERDRKREGGVGAALTERERERRMAEERQRKIDELQRQQLEYAQSTGASVAGGPPGMYDMYGGGGGGGVSPGGHMMNPMMMNPMMTGNSMMMGNPMMMGGMMPYGGFPQGWGMPAQTPQQYQMMAAQAAAAEAYRNAMMSFSQAGSVAPSEAGGGDQRAVSPLPPAQMMGSPWGGMPGMLNPMMTGMSGFGPQGYAMAPPNFGGYDNLQPPAGPHARFSSYQSSPVNHGGNLEEPPSRQDSNESPANGQRAPRHGPS